MFTEEKINSIRKDIDNALEVIAKNYHIKFDETNIDESDLNHFKCYISATERKATRPETRVLAWCDYMGYRNLFEETIHFNSKDYIIIDYDNTAKKYKLICKRTDNGATYGLPPEAVLSIEDLYKEK